MTFEYVSTLVAADNHNDSGAVHHTSGVVAQGSFMMQIMEKSSIVSRI